jgi:hypothetical protein
MKKLSQRNPRWSWRKLGSCNTTIGKQGCTVTDISMILGSNPARVNNMLKRGGYTNGCLVNWVPAAKILGMKWYGRSAKAKFFPTIAEVKLGRNPHFVVFVDRTHIVDPWDRFPRVKRNSYRVYGYRNIKARPKKKVSLEEAMNAYYKRYQKKYGKKPNYIMRTTFRAFLRLRGFK